MPSDRQILDWLQAHMDSAEGRTENKNRGDRWLSTYLFWGKRHGASGDIRAAITEAMGRTPDVGGKTK